MSPLESPGVALAVTLAACFAGAIVPVVNAELYVLSLGAVAPPALLPPLVLAATLAHMAGKAVLYCAGRAADRLPPGRLARRVAAARARLEGRARLGGALVFASAAVGVPPFYAVAVVSGALRYDFRRFVVLGFAGRLLRFAALIALPAAARAWWP